MGAFAYHDFGGLDDGVGGLAGFQAQLLDGGQGDGGADGRAVHVEGDDAVDGAFVDFDDFAGELISGAEFHDVSSLR